MKRLYRLALLLLLTYPVACTGLPDSFADLDDPTETQEVSEELLGDLWVQGIVARGGAAVTAPPGAAFSLQVTDESHPLFGTGISVPAGATSGATSVVVAAIVPVFSSRLAAAPGTDSVRPLDLICPDSTADAVTAGAVFCVEMFEVFGGPVLLIEDIEVYSAAATDGLLDFQVAHIVLGNASKREPARLVSLPSHLSDLGTRVTGSSRELGIFVVYVDLQPDAPGFNDGIDQDGNCTATSYDNQDAIVRQITNYFSDNRLVRRETWNYADFATGELENRLLFLFDSSDRITMQTSLNDSQEYLYDNALAVTAMVKRNAEGSVVRFDERTYKDDRVQEISIDNAPLGSEDATIAFYHNSLGMMDNYAYVKGSFHSEGILSYDDEARIDGLRRRNDSLQYNTGSECLHSALDWDEDGNGAWVDEWADNCEDGQMTDDALEIRFENCSASFVYWYFTYFELGAY